MAIAVKSPKSTLRVTFSLSISQKGTIVGQENEAIGQEKVKIWMEAYVQNERFFGTRLDRRNSAKQGRLHNQNQAQTLLLNGLFFGVNAISI